MCKCKCHSGGQRDNRGDRATVELRHGVPGSATSVAAGRLAYTFGLKGACLSIDTACSSSLVAAHYGGRDIAAGDCARALAAGVNLTLSPAKTSAFRSRVGFHVPHLHP